MSPLAVFMLGMAAGAGLVGLGFWCLRQALQRHYEAVLKPILAEEQALNDALTQRRDELRESLEEMRKVADEWEAERGRGAKLSPDAAPWAHHGPPVVVPERDPAAHRDEALAELNRQPIDDEPLSSHWEVELDPMDRGVVSRREKEPSR